MTVNASNDWIVQLHIKEITPKNKHLHTDFYCEQGGNAWPTSGVKGFDSGFGITYSTV